MVRRSVRKSFKNVYWTPPALVPPGPCLFFANHHGWFDGYLMYHLVKALDRPALDWIQEFGAFPLFAKIGGMPFPADDPAARAKTVRQTIRQMKTEKRSLVLFPEGVLHYPPEILPFGKSFEFVARQVPEATLVPVAIRYEHALHERPEAFLRLGSPVPHGPNLLARARATLQTQLETLAADIRKSPRTDFQILARGTDSVNERWDMRRLPNKNRSQS